MSEAELLLTDMLHSQEMNRDLRSKTQSGTICEQLSQQQKAAEALLAEVMKDRERLVLDNESAVEGLLKTISSKDQLLKVRCDVAVSSNPFS